MSCYHPLKAFVIGVDSHGTKKLKITSYDVDHLEQRQGRMDSVLDDRALTAMRSPEQSSTFVKCYREFIEIPCGKCWGCRLQYSRTWANRLMMELEDHEVAWFLTLTYDDAHVPKSAYPDRDTGEAIDCMTLRKRDWQLFMKRLRKEYNSEKIRFFASGEYGDRTARPHYHAIVYDLRFDENELREYSKSRSYILYRSERLERVWQHGRVIICHVTWDTCAYVARYVMKKAGGKMAEFYDNFNIEPEFCLMSRKPGIGKNYYLRHKDDIYAYDEVNLKTDKKGINMKPPRYFDQLFGVEDPDRLEELKSQRRLAAERAKALELERTDLGYLDYLRAKEHEAIERNRQLLRRDKYET